MECPQIKRRENQHSKPSFPACAQRKSWCWPASRFPCLVNCSMWQEQHKALVSRINPSLVLLVLWASDFGVQPPGHNQYSLEHHVKLDRTLLVSPHSWTRPADALYSLAEAKAAGKLIFVGCFCFLFGDFSSIRLFLGDVWAVWLNPPRLCWELGCLLAPGMQRGEWGGMSAAVRLLYSESRLWEQPLAAEAAWADSKSFRLLQFWPEVVFYVFWVFSLHWKWT